MDEDFVAEETTTEQVIPVEQRTFEETTVCVQLTVEQQEIYSGCFSEESLWTDDATVQETTVQGTTIEQTTVQETTIVETELSSATGQEPTISVVTTKVTTTEYTKIAEFKAADIVVSLPPPAESFFDESVDLVSSRPAPPVPMDLFVFAPILASPVMVKPPAESNGVNFAPTYVWVMSRRIDVNIFLGGTIFDFDSDIVTGLHQLWCKVFQAVVSVWKYCQDWDYL